jgi:hypothetical protein
MMKTFETTKNNSGAAVLCSRRIKDGVEIFEQETHQVIRVEGDRYVTASASAEPSLVIGDSITSATKLFIAKTRSEVEGLDSLLKTLMRPPLKAK